MHIFALTFDLDFESQVNELVVIHTSNKSRPKVRWFKR